MKRLGTKGIDVLLNVVYYGRIERILNHKMLSYFKWGRDSFHKRFFFKNGTVDLYLESVSVLKGHMNFSRFSVFLLIYVQIFISFLQDINRIL